MSDAYFQNNYLDAGSDLQTTSAKLSQKACQATGYNSLQSFLNHVDSYGVQLQNNFEVTFDGIEGITFFVQSINLPEAKQNTCDVYFDGVAITIPVNFEAGHDFSMTVINDARGFIYPVFRSYMALDALNRFTDTGKHMQVKVLTGQIEIAGKQPYPGAEFECYSVRITNVGGLSFSQDGNNIQTFEVQGKMVSFHYWPNGTKAGNEIQSFENREVAEPATKNNKEAKKKAKAKKASRAKKAAFESRF